jgi:glutamate 5-kinase
MDKKTIVIKIGTSTIFNEEELDFGTVKKIGYEVNQLMKEYEKKPVLVVSGAVGLGMHSYGLKQKPVDKIMLQMCAGVGQKDLMNAYDLAFKGYAPTAQMLFTYEDLENASREKNIEAVIQGYIQNGSIPLINYNDTINEAEVELDNDKFGAEIALYAHASQYIIITNVNGLFDAQGNLIPKVTGIDQKLYEICNGANKLGIGGMKTKLEAAELCLGNGIEMIIGNIKNYTLSQLLMGNESIKRTVFSNKV